MKVTQESAVKEKHEGKQLEIIHTQDTMATHLPNGTVVRSRFPHPGIIEQLTWAFQVNTAYQTGY